MQFLNEILLLVVLIGLIAVNGIWTQLQINTPSLGTIQGEISPLASNVRQFIGIPFAQPPIGSRRFKSPVASSTLQNNFSSTFYNATAAAHLGGFPSLTCMQISYARPYQISGQEDCLYLDIHLPSNISSGTLLPVVIYIYGGGFENADPRDPTAIISSYQNIIYVSIRYRVNVFGFMASTALSASRSGPIQSSGLQGFEDQQMAMTWVQNNIQAFGGDPNLVTLQGHSAGAISICTHLVAPASQGLFQRVIIESGGCDVPQFTLAQMEIIGDTITASFCNSLSDVIACLQSIDASTLLQYAQDNDYLNLFSPNAIHPLIDGLIIPDSITNLFQQSKFSTNVSLLTGTTSSEFASFIAGKFEPGWQITNVTQAVLSQWVQLYSQGQSAYLNATYNPYNASYLLATLVNYYGLTDALSTALFQCPVHRTAVRLANNGSGSVYLYSFNYVPLSSLLVGLSQSVHGQELPFVFDTASSSPSAQAAPPTNTFDANEQILASAMSLLWVRFIVYGNPNTPLNNEPANMLITQLTQLGGWPVYRATSTSDLSPYLVFSNTVAGSSNATISLSTGGYHQPTCSAWDAVVVNAVIVKRCNKGYSGANCLLTANSNELGVTHSLFTLILSFCLIFVVYPF